MNQLIAVALGGSFGAVLRFMVSTGVYRCSRNPMYVGVLLLVMGWSVYLSSPVLSVYTVFLAIGFHIRVVTYEEPRLELEFGEEWEKYKSAVSRWLPL